MRGLMKKNFRENFGLTDPYHSLCREERNLCALLYHLLLSNPDNLRRFLMVVGCKPQTLENAEIYVEYAHLRDIWYALGESDQPLEKRNQIRRAFIVEELGLDRDLYVNRLSVQDFNRVFVARPSPSSTHIESPSNWSIKKLNSSFPKDGTESETFLEATRFKWCFNAKPDIVIFLSPDEAVSIEAKLESAEGKYPSGRSERQIFKSRNLETVSQTDIQEQIFKLLGIHAKHVILARNSDGEKTFAWSNVLRALDANQEPNFITKQLRDFLSRC